MKRRNKIIPKYFLGELREMMLTFNLFFWFLGVYWTGSQCGLVFSIWVEQDLVLSSIQVVELDLSLSFIQIFI